MIERIPTNKVQAIMARLAEPVAIALPVGRRRSPRRPSRNGARQTHAKKMPNHVQQWLNSARLAIGWAVILLLMGVGISIYLQQVSETAIIGRNAQILDAYAQDLRFINNQLRQQIAAEASLQQLQLRTDMLRGEYVAADPEAVEYVTVLIIPEPEQVEAQPVVYPMPAKTIQDALYQLARDAVMRLGQGASGGQ